jgi:hypothetical protein
MSPLFKLGTSIAVCGVVAMLVSMVYAAFVGLNASDTPFFISISVALTGTIFILVDALDVVWRT